MRFPTDANKLAKQYLFLATATQQELETKTTRTPDGKTVDKTTIDGKALYSARALRAVRIDEDGNPTGEDASVSLALLTQSPIKFQHLYALSGEVFITPYVNGQGRLGLSIQATSIQDLTSKGGAN